MTFCQLLQRASERRPKELSKFIGKGLIAMGNQSGTLKHHLETAEKTGALSFGDKKLTEFPEALQKVAHNLRSLDLSANKLSHLPSTIGSFSHLKTLRLSGNRITTLPEELGRLNKLEALYVAQNLLTSLPKSVEKLKNLKEVDVSQNQIQVRAHHGQNE